MNCIILLLLLFCGGNSCSNGCSCIGNSNRSSCGNNNSCGNSNNSCGSSSSCGSSNACGVRCLEDEDMTRCTKRNLVSNKISMCAGCAETKRCKQSLILLTMLYWSAWTVYVFFTEQEQESFVHSSANICPPYRVSAIMPTSMCSSEVPESQ